MKTYVYVDGFNLYYGALKGSRFKWLNLKIFTEQLLPTGHVVEKIKYFTARVSGASDPDSPKRQQIYLGALSTLPEIEVHFGSFLSKTIRRPTVNLPIAGRPLSCPDPVVIPNGKWEVAMPWGPQILSVGPIAAPARRGQAPHPPMNAVLTEVHTMEEKGSDVNLAAHLLNDAWKESYEAAVVISNDTDLVEPIRMVTTERKKPVFVVAPGRFGVSKPLANVATYQRHVRPAILAAAQFPNPIPGTTIRKPPNW